MDLNQLNEWVDTDDGKAWLDGQKSGLLSKRDELLKEAKTAGGRIAELEQRLSETESRASDADAFLYRTLADAVVFARLCKHS